MTPVMSVEAVEGLSARAGGAFVDCTLGDGGHTAAILAASAPTGRVLALDADPEALIASQERLAPFGRRVRMVRSNFARVACVAKSEDFAPAHGVLFDLGLSSRQLDGGERGFSFQRPGPLDMRFGPDEGADSRRPRERAGRAGTGRPVVEVRRGARARGASRAASWRRAPSPTPRAWQRWCAARRATDAGAPTLRPGRSQALRIAVNGELAALEAGLRGAADILADNGRLVTIAYHSLEDRMVKEFVRGDERLMAVNRKVIRPSAEETRRNRRSRSARLRVAEKIHAP